MALQVNRRADVNEKKYKKSKKSLVKVAYLW